MNVRASALLKEEILRFMAPSGRFIVVTQVYAVTFREINNDYAKINGVNINLLLRLKWDTCILHENFAAAVVITFIDKAKCIRIYFCSPCPLTDWSDLFYLFFVQICVKLDGELVFHMYVLVMVLRAMSTNSLFLPHKVMCHIEVAFSPKEIPI